MPGIKFDFGHRYFKRREVTGVKVTTEKGMRVKIRNALTGLGIYREEFEWEIQMLAELFIRR